MKPVPNLALPEGKKETKKTRKKEQKNKVLRSKNGCKRETRFFNWCFLYVCFIFRKRVCLICQTNLLQEKRVLFYKKNVRFSPTFFFTG